MKTNRNGLKKRMAQLEEATRKRTQKLLLRNCKCREITFFHTSADLKAILDNEATIPCPVHGIRNLGTLRHRWYAPDSLLPEDRKYCSCPPNCQRDYAEGRRLTKPTEEEIEADFQEEIRRRRPWDAGSALRCQEELRYITSLESGYYAWLRERMDNRTKDSPTKDG